MEPLKGRLLWAALIRPTIVLLLLVAPAAAVPVTQQITLTVTTIENIGTPTMNPHRFDVLPAIGNSYIGTFDVDHTLLLVDGVRIPGMVSNLFLDIEGLVWAQNQPSDLQGFRSPSGGLGPPIQDFTIVSGAIVEMVAGWFSSGDVASVDLFDAGFGLSGFWRGRGAGDATVSGFYDITPVQQQIPQGSALVLLLIGAVLIVVAPLRAPRND